MKEIKDHPRDAFDLAKSKGWDPARLTPAQNRWIAAELRSKKQLIVDGFKATTSFAATTLRLRVVTDEKAERNEAQCRSNECGKFGILTDGSPVCNNCQCSGAMLRSKWKDSTTTCPAINPKTQEPYWDNTKDPSTPGSIPRANPDAVRSGSH